MERWYSTHSRMSSFWSFVIKHNATEGRVEAGIERIESVKWPANIEYNQYLHFKCDIVQQATNSTNLQTPRKTHL